jgi:uncharacterized protein (TIGR02300 family)
MTVAVHATKIDRGVKRRCGSCDALFYDLLRDPIHCPKCGTAFTAGSRSALSSAKRFKASVSRTRARVAPTPIAKVEEAKRSKAKSDEAEADEDAEGDDLILDAEDDEN